MKVTTWQTVSGDKIDLTRAQEKMLRERGAWPKNRRGEEYAQVSFGLHVGQPTFSDDESLLEATPLGKSAAR